MTQNFVPNDELYNVKHHSSGTKIKGVLWYTNVHALDIYKQYCDAQNYEL